MIWGILSIVFTGLLAYLLGRSQGFNEGTQYMLDIYTGKRRVKSSKNPFEKLYNE